MKLRGNARSERKLPQGAPKKKTERTSSALDFDLPAGRRKRRRIQVEALEPASSVKPDRASHGATLSTAEDDAGNVSTDNEAEMIKHQPFNGTPTPSKGRRLLTHRSLPSRTRSPSRVVAGYSSTPALGRGDASMTVEDFSNMLLNSPISTRMDASPGAKCRHVAKRPLDRAPTHVPSDGAFASGSPLYSTHGGSLNSLILPSPDAGHSSPSKATLSSKSRSAEGVDLLLQTSGSRSLNSTPSARRSRTYAGRSRSFLIELPASSAEGLMDTLGDSRETLRESYAELHARWSLDDSEEVPSPSSSPSRPVMQGKGKRQAQPRPQPLPNGMMNDLKSITELRTKGESRRFLDEVGYLFEGMESTSSIGTRRASALEIVKKLCDTDFARKARAADFISRAWDALRRAGAGDGDKILDVILAFFSALVARDRSSLMDLAQRSNLTATLFRILDTIDSEKDVIAPLSPSTDGTILGSAGLARTERTMLTNLSNIIAKSDVMSTEPLMTIRLLISQTLLALPPSSICADHLTSLLHDLQRELLRVPPRVSAYVQGSPIFPDSSRARSETSVSFEHIANALSLLDAFLLGHWAGAEQLCKDALAAVCDDGFVRGLIALCVMSEIIVNNSSLSDMHATVHKCTTIALRILVNLSHEDSEWSRRCLGEPLAFPYIMRTIARAQAELLRSSSSPAPSEDRSDDGGHHTAMDRLCLALGFLTNLVQETEGAGVWFDSASMDPECTAERACIEQCQCPDRVNALECLVSIYLRQRPRIGEDDGEAGSHFVRGHLAVLLGLVVKSGAGDDGLRLARLLLGALPGSSDGDKLDSLIEQAEGFALVYAEMHSRVGRVGSLVPMSDAGDEGEDGGGGDGQHESRSVVGVGTGEQVTRDVIAFFKAIRDRHS